MVHYQSEYWLLMRNHRSIYRFNECPPVAHIIRAHHAIYTIAVSHACKRIIVSSYSNMLHLVLKLEPRKHSNNHLIDEPLQCCD